MASIFDMLRLVEKYPQAFLIDSEKERELQLRTLEAVIIGYSSAIHVHKVPVPIEEFNQAFSQFLREKFGWSTCHGAIRTLVLESPTADAAWERFWLLLWEFEKSLNLPAD
ncbi:hypothetical protein HUW62_13245 [Myxococcus sp. AM011]|uniref:hypothetical protein n=1 Tax=Myxococcus sp. AM011 TaxID=2745200 RepID=UPI0015950834|nr:hypothetical protein [Myxococcus sp. AM011]NVJ22183.1 hypothetical protein [Myxococcus sp. AM011]